MCVGGGQSPPPPTHPGGKEGGPLAPTTPADVMLGLQNKADAVRAKTLGRFGKKIIQLAKAGGPDPTTNAKLAELLKQAKEAGKPAPPLPPCAALPCVAGGCTAATASAAD